MSFFTVGKHAGGCEEFAHTLGSILGQYIYIYEGIQHGMTQLFKNSVGFCIELMMALGIALFSFKDLSVIKSIHQFPGVVLGSGPKVSMTSRSQGLTA